MTDQIVEQLVVKEQSAPIEGRLSRPVALFNPDGTPLVPVQGSVTPEYPKLLASWNFDGSPDIVNEALDIYFDPDGTLAPDLGSSIFNDSEKPWALKYISDDFVHYTAGATPVMIDEQPVAPLAQAVFFPGSPGHKYNLFASWQHLVQPIGPGTVLENVAISYKFMSSLEPDYSAWNNEWGIHSGISQTFNAADQDNEAWIAQIGEWFQGSGNNIYSGFTSVLNHDIIVPRNLMLDAYVSISMFYRIQVADQETHFRVLTQGLQVSVTDLGPLWPEA